MGYCRIATGGIQFQLLPDHLLLKQTFGVALVSPSRVRPRPLSYPFPFMNHPTILLYLILNEPHGHPRNCEHPNENKWSEWTKIFGFRFSEDEIEETGKTHPYKLQWASKVPNILGICSMLLEIKHSHGFRSRSNKAQNVLIFHCKNMQRFTC
jgi:hypothetical protein